MDTETLRKKNPIYNIFMLTLSVYVLFVVFVDTFFVRNNEIKQVLQTIDFGICAIFLLDFFLCLYIADNKLQYLKWGWIDLISSIPLVDPFRWARISRVIRILRFLRTLKSLRVLIASIQSSKIKSLTLAILLISFFAYSLCSCLILEFEQGAGSSIQTAQDALWWSFLNIMNAKVSIQQAKSDYGIIATIILNKVGLLIFAYFNAVIISWLVSKRTQLK